MARRHDRLRQQLASERRARSRLDAAVPFLLASRWKELGAIYESAPLIQPFAIRDRNLVTGQNPASAEPVARLVMEALADTDRNRVRGG